VLAAVGLIWLATFFVSQNILSALYLGAWNTVWSFLLIFLGLAGIIAGLVMRRVGRR
jgi:hypothetical protein